MRFLSSQAFTVDHLLSFTPRYGYHVLASPVMGWAPWGAVQDTINSSYFPWSGPRRGSASYLTVFPFSHSFSRHFCLHLTTYCLFSVVLISFLLLSCVTVHLPVANKQNIALVSRQASLTTRREWSVYPISSTFNAFCRKTSKIEDNYAGCRFLRRSIGVETGRIYTKRTLGREIMDARHA
ncbi:hypothetical protein LB505_001525 [Fusarium chuoi]|nr:hypothetical protein LB505_001525 [Fusarium chuoi]